MGRVATTALVGSVCLALGLIACTSTPPGPDGPPSPSASPSPPAVHTAELRLPSEPTTVLDAGDPAARAAATSATLFDSAPVAVVAPVADVAAQVRAAAVAVALGAPLLLDAGASGSAAADAATDASGTSEPDTAGAPDAPAGSPAPTRTAPATSTSTPDPTADELDRLGVLAVLTVGAVDVLVDAAVTVLAVPDDAAAVSELLRIGLAPAPWPADGQELATVAGLDRAAPTLPTVDTSPTTSPTATTALPLIELADPLDGALVLTSGDPLDLASVATARAAGVDVLTVPGGDPRATSTTVQAIARAEPTAVVGLGAVFGTAEALGWKTDTAATGVELPGGGQLVFPGRRFVALYGTPHFAGLGVLGEQDIPSSIARAQGLAAEYQPLTDDVVVPAFEMIVTVASAGAGPDGNYSNELPVESFVPWIEAARDAGVYVVIDLQPGRTDFLTQARLYEPLLTYPNVGLALDPEWRLAPDQVHLRQIGSVGVDEINAVSAYLAELTRAERLPQKLLVLHQFMLRMIDGRERLDLSHPELALLIHADGQGSQGAKAGTWAALHQGAPDGIAWGWKNFIDEDSPTLTPEQTYTRVDPIPDFVSYQ